jgi:hypothetical protein
VRATLPILTALLLCLPLTMRADGDSVRVWRHWPKCDLMDAANVHVSRHKEQARYIRCFDFGAVAPSERLMTIKDLSAVLNGLSHAERIALPEWVPHTEQGLAWIDVSLLRARNDHKGLERLLKALDDLGAKGSGRYQFPEPYYHSLVKKKVKRVVREEYEKKESYWVKVYGSYGYYWEERYRTVTKHREKLVEKEELALAQASHLNAGSVAGAKLLTGTEFPVYDVRWFVANAGTAPRYYELLDFFSEDDFRVLAQAYPKGNNFRAKVRGVVVRSGVTHLFRRIEREPTEACKGTGSIHTTFDFIRAFGNDPDKDLLGVKADAKELIANLPNGMQFYLLLDGKGKRLDKALADAALDNRGPLRERQVWNGVLSCAKCHLSEGGIIEADERVRARMLRQVTLAVGRLKEHDPDRGEQIESQYMFGDYNKLARRDNELVGAAVAAATMAGDGKPVSPARLAKHLSETVRKYNEDFVTAEMLARETGYSLREVKSALASEGLDPVFADVADDYGGDRARIEIGFAQFSGLLYERSRKQR